mgnify:CR=1 FL=1
MPEPAFFLRGLSERAASPLDWFDPRFLEDAARGRCRANIPARTPDGRYVSTRYGIRARNATVSACSSSAHAIGEAMRTIQHGDADVMIGGGAHSMIHPFGVTGFNRLTALSTFNENPTCASRPFDCLSHERLTDSQSAHAVIHDDVLDDGAHAGRHAIDCQAQDPCDWTTCIGFTRNQKHGSLGFD